MTTPPKISKTPKSGHPKFKILRKRCQYKNKDEIPQVNVEPLPHESEKKKKRKQKYFNRASPMKIVKLYKHQNDSHRHVISVNGFASFLGIKCSKLHPGLCNFLMAHFNTESCELEFPGRGSIPITDNLVQKVLGLPMGKFPVVYQVDEEAITFVMATLGFGNGKQPKLSEVESKLKGMELGDPVYFMLWVLYVVCSMLAPTTGVHICPKCYPAIMDPTKIKLLNWCRFVIVILIETAKAKGKKNAFKACMSFLMITYIDSLETKNIVVKREGPRICAWDNKSVARAIAQDTKEDGSFGMLPLKECYRKNKVLMLSTPARIEKFVKANVPQNCGEEEILRYTVATREMYSEIDDAVAKFLKKVTSTNSDPRQPESSHKFKASRSSVKKMQHQAECSAPPPSGSRKRQHREEIIDTSSSEDEETKSDSDYVQNSNGYETDDDVTVLDDESINGTQSGDEDFKENKSRNPRRDRHPALQSRWCRQSPRVDIKHKEVKHKKKEGPKQEILYTEAKPIQSREPHNGDAHLATAYSCIRKKEEVQNNSFVDGNLPHPESNLVMSESSKKRKNHNPARNSDAVLLHKKQKGVHTSQDSRGKNTLYSEYIHVPASQFAIIDSQRIQEEGVQVESKVSVNQVLDSLEQLKTYDTESPSSNEVATSKESPNHAITRFPQTPSSQVVPEGNRGCLNVSPNAKIVSESDGCKNHQQTEAIELDVKGECSIQSMERLPSQTKKSVSWADQLGAINDNNQDEYKLETESVNPVNHVQKNEVTATIPVQMQEEQSEKDSPGSTVMRKPVTRSMSPLKQIKTSSPVTRSISSANPLLILKEGLSFKAKRPLLDEATNSKELDSPYRAIRFGKMEATPSPLGKKTSNLQEDSMSRKLVFESADRDDPRRCWEPGEAPSFSPGFDDPPKPRKVKEYKIDAVTGLPVITSSNEDDFYGPAVEYEILATQLGEAYFPTTDTCSSGPSKVNEEAQSSSKASKPDNIPPNKLKLKQTSDVTVLDDPASKTPVPQPHQKRVIKPSTAQMSPFMPYDNNKLTSVNKSTVEIYNAVCKHGVKADTELKEEVIIDYGSTFLYLPDLADSVAPGGWLSNSTCEVALHILSQEMAPQKKYIMPLVIANKLRERSFHTKDIKKVFKFSDANCLDHKEQIMFPVLQNLSSVSRVFCGHYYVINLNLKAERFEVMDSMRKEGDKALKADCTKIINSVKEMWATNYKLSNIKIDNFETIFIPVPKQLTTFDCGYFMLKCIECWDGRKMAAFCPWHMPKFRMLYTRKWIDNTQNTINWEDLLFR